MIPKIIHYCWLSDDPIPEKFQNFISEWEKIMPNYQVIKWDRKRINLDEHPFAKAAFEDKRYAFAADYIRAYALVTMGGIYLDSDVKVFKSFDDYLNCSYFTSVENHLNKINYFLLKNRYITKDGKRLSNSNIVFGIGLQAAIVGAEKGNPLIADILNYYQTHDYYKNGISFRITAPTIHSRFAEKYGFKYIDEYQELDYRIIIYPSYVFASPESYIISKASALHVCYGSWVSGKHLWKAIKKYPLLKKMKAFHMMYQILTKFNYFNNRFEGRFIE